MRLKRRREDRECKGLQLRVGGLLRALFFFSGCVGMTKEERARGGWELAA